MIRHLLVPGLLGPMPGLEHAARPALPQLETLLARADRFAEPVGYAAALFALFGVDSPFSADFPTAAVCYLADTGEAPSGFLLHADPLQLLPDRDRVLAFDLDDDPLAADEIHRLVEAFNGHFDDAGVHLHGSPAGHLYMHCDRTPAIRTHPLAEVLGRSLDPFLPTGDDRPWWHGLLNEVQMLCHAQEFNREREARGRSTLDGLWFSGGGCLPSAGQGQVARLVGDELLPRGLHALSGGSGGDELIVDRAPQRAVLRGDADAWLRALTELEGRSAGLLRDCAELHVHPCNGTVYRWSARSARRFWRRKRSLFECLEVHPEAPWADKGV